MRIVGRNKLSEFSSTHADARGWVENWLAQAEATRWTTPRDVKSMHASASFLAGDVVIFNIKGNRYRMETQIIYSAGTIIVRWIGTHAEYDKR